MKPTKNSCNWYVINISSTKVYGLFLEFTEFCPITQLQISIFGKLIWSLCRKLVQFLDVLPLPRLIMKNGKEFVNLDPLF